MAVLVDALSASAEPPGCSASAGELLPTGSANGICLPGTPADTAEGLRPGHQNTGPHLPPTGGGDARRPGAARVCVCGGGVRTRNSSRALSAWPRAWHWEVLGEQEMNEVPGLLKSNGIGVQSRPHQ